MPIIIIEMDKIIKVVSAKKKFSNAITKTTTTTTDSTIDGSDSLNVDHVNGYILAHLDPESKSKQLTEKNLVGNSWGPLISEILDNDDVKNDNNTTTVEYEQTKSSIPFLMQRTPSPVPIPKPNNRNKFRAKAPSARKEKKTLFYT